MVLTASSHVTRPIRPPLGVSGQFYHSARGKPAPLWQKSGLAGVLIRQTGCQSPQPTHTAHKQWLSVSRKASASVYWSDTSRHWELSVYKSLSRQQYSLHDSGIWIYRCYCFSGAQYQAELEPRLCLTLGAFSSGHTASQAALWHVERCERLDNIPSTAFNRAQTDVDWTRPRSQPLPVIV